jgi:hypothetical protein
MFLHVLAKIAMPFVWGICQSVSIRRVDNYEMFCTLEKVSHVLLKYPVLHKMKDYVEGHRGFSTEDLRVVNETLRIIQEEALSPIRGKLTVAKPDRLTCDIQTDVTRIFRLSQLVSVAATKFDHGCDPVLPYIPIYGCCLEFRQSAIGSTA